MSGHDKKPAKRAELLEAIRRAYPHGVVSDDVLSERASYYETIRDDVRNALNAVKGAVVLYDRPPEGRAHWDDDSDPEEDPPDWVEEASSYDLVFLVLEGEQFQFHGEMDKDDFTEDEPGGVMVPTVGHIGCAVGISLVAPFAAISFAQMEFAESGSHTLPDIWPTIYDLDGKETDLDAYYEEWFGEECLRALHSLRSGIVRRLGGFGIRVLSKHELKARVPGLKPDPAMQMDAKKKTATASDALFFPTVDYGITGL